MTELGNLQKKTLDLFAKSSLREQFYWTGGTALSFIYLHHRLSQDLDLFSGKPFSREKVGKFVEGLKKPLSLDKIEQKRIFDRWEFVLHNDNQLRIEFVHYEHPSIKSRQKQQGILIDSLEDIATNKVMALFDRNDPKDVVDLYFILKQKGVNVKNLLSWVEKKFGFEISESSFWSECAEQIDSLDKIKPLLLISSANNGNRKQAVIDEIKNFFRTRTVDYLEAVLD